MNEALAPAPAALPLWRRVMPFVLAVLLLGFVLVRLDFAAFWAAVSRTHYVLFFLFTILFNVALLAADVLATQHVYNRLVCPVRYSELFVIRAASYLPSLLNHHIGQAWLTFFMAKVYKAPLWRVAGATLLVYATTFGCVYLIGAAALPFNHGRVAWLAPTTGLIGASGLVYMLVIGLKPSILKARQATSALLESGVRGHLVALAYRLPHVVVLFIGTWVPFMFFGVEIPFADALAYVPIVMLVTALPITPQGVGTRDLVALQLLAGYASGSASEQTGAIAATTLSWACALTLVQVGFSPLFMRRAQRMLQA
ncbi:MAG: flippase-like domain-containing protein [Myxococcales bacterium]|nr:flippase-like domain-containing protein [Myxococcales bacterium]